MNPREAEFRFFYERETKMNIVNQRDPSTNETALHALIGHFDESHADEIVRLLIDTGLCTYDAEDNQGRNAYEFACATANRFWSSKFSGFSQRR